MSNEVISETSPLTNSLQEIKKLRGLENAALQHAQHRQKPNDEIAPPAFFVDIGRPEVVAHGYVPPPVRAEAANGELAYRTENAPGFRSLSAKVEVAENARVQMNLRVGDQLAIEKSNEDRATDTSEAASMASKEPIENTTLENEGSQIDLRQSIASKLQEQVQRMEGNGQVVVAGENASAKNSVQTDQRVASGTLVVSDGLNVKANLAIDMVAMTTPKNLVSPSALQAELVRKELPPTATDALEGVATTELDALEQPNREEATAANQGEIEKRDDNMDARWLLLKDLEQSIRGHLGWQLDKTLPTREESPTANVSQKV